MGGPQDRCAGGAERRTGRFSHAFGNSVSFAVARFGYLARPKGSTRGVGASRASINQAIANDLVSRTGRGLNELA